MFTITIDTGNAAFDECPSGEIRRIINEVWMDLDTSIDTAQAAMGNCIDCNGNIVGEWKYVID